MEEMGRGPRSLDAEVTAQSRSLQGEDTTGAQQCGEGRGHRGHGPQQYSVRFTLVHAPASMVQELDQQQVLLALGRERFCIRMLMSVANLKNVDSAPLAR